MTQKTAKHQRDIQRKSATISLEGEGVVGAAIASSKYTPHVSSQLQYLSPLAIVTFFDHIS